MENGQIGNLLIKLVLERGKKRGGRSKARVQFFLFGDGARKVCERFTRYNTKKAIHFENTGTENEEESTTMSTTDSAEEYESVRFR